MKQGELRSIFLKSTLGEMNCSPRSNSNSRSIKKFKVYKKDRGHQVICSKVDALISRHLTLSVQSNMGGWCFIRFSGNIVNNTTESYRGALLIHV